MLNPMHMHVGYDIIVYVFMYNLINPTAQQLRLLINLIVKDVMRLAYGNSHVNL